MKSLWNPAEDIEFMMFEWFTILQESSTQDRTTASTGGFGLPPFVYFTLSKCFHSSIIDAILSFSSQKIPIWPACKYGVRPPVFLFQQCSFTFLAMFALHESQTIHFPAVMSTKGNMESIQLMVNAAFTHAFGCVVNRISPLCLWIIPFLATLWIMVGGAFFHQSKYSSMR